MKEKTYKDPINDLISEEYPEIRTIVKNAADSYSEEVCKTLPDKEEQERAKIAFTSGLCAGLILAQKAVKEGKL